MKDDPRYKHGCPECVFLGQHEKWDLYFCPQTGNIPTVISRYGDEGSDYESGLYVGLPQLDEARARARTRGLLKEKS